MEQAPNNFTAEDIVRYHNGTLSAQEMHRMEKAALDDPFLADALDGYVHGLKPLQDLADIRAQLKQRTGKKVLVIPLALKIAAMVLLLAGFAWIAYLFNADQRDIARAPEVKTPVQQDREEAALPAPDTVIAGTIPSAGQDQAIVQRKEPFLQKKEKDRASESQPYTIIQTPQNNEAVNREAAAERTSADVTTKVAPVAAAQSRNENGKRQGEPRESHISGVVVDTNNKSVPHATVQVLHNKTSYLVAADGTFSIPEADTMVKVSVQSVGYESSQAMLRNNTPNKIVLQPSRNALNEGLVSGYKKARAETVRITMYGATPVAGLPSYERYVVEHLKPFSSSQAWISGAVELAFEIDPTGKPFDIKVEKSLCKPCDAEAIRVITEGPQLKKTGKNKRARIKILF